MERGTVAIAEEKKSKIYAPLPRSGLISCDRTDLNSAALLSSLSAFSEYSLYLVIQLET